MSSVEKLNQEVAGEAENGSLPEVVSKEEGSQVTEAVQEKPVAPKKKVLPSLNGLFTFHITGNTKDPNFHRVKELAELAADEFRRHVAVKIVSLTPLEWELFVQERAVCRVCKYCETT
jgi:hypothetical protein